MSIFHSASSEALFEPLCHCLDRHKQRSLGVPGRGPHAELGAFLGSIPFSPCQFANLGIFGASEPLAAQVEKFWVSIYQLGSSFLVMCVFGVANGSKRRNTGTLLSKEMEEEVEWRLVFRPRVQVLPSYGSVSGARRSAIRASEKDIGSTLAEAFSSVRDHVVGDLLIPCWSIDSPDGSIGEVIEEDALKRLLDPSIGMWIDEWLVVGFDESYRSWGAFDTPWALSPRVVINEALFKERKELGMYGNDINAAVQQTLADLLPGVGAMLVLHRLGEEMLPMCRQLSCRAYRTVNLGSSRGLRKSELSELSTTLNGLLPRIADFRSVMHSLWDWMVMWYGLRDLKRHRLSGNPEDETFPDAIKFSLSRTLREARRVTAIAGELASMKAAAEAQRSGRRTNLVLALLTFVLVVIGVMSICLQCAQSAGVALVVGLGIAFEGLLLYLLARVLFPKL